MIKELEPLIIKEDEPTVNEVIDEINDEDTSQMSLFENGKK